MSEENCGGCRFGGAWEFDQTKMVTCRRMPPVLIPSMRGAELAADAWEFPVLLEEEWCGEWQPVRRQAAAAPEEQAWADVAPSASGLTVRTANALMAAGVMSMREALSMSGAELLMIPFFGPKSLKELHDWKPAAPAPKR